MRNILALLVFFFVLVAANGQSLYIKTFGSNTSKPLIFLHGGPGYNCAAFEATTAQALADSGYFVIVYDRRGEGRSIDKNAEYTFDEAFDDLKSIYKQFGIEKATLLGHSFGGVVATLFADKYPAYINSVVLISAPASLQETFKTIIERSEAIYKERNDKPNLNYINILKVMDTTTMTYASYCFQHAMQNGFYSPKKMSDEAKGIYSALKKDTLYGYVSQMTYPAPQGFLRNEKYTTINLTLALKSLLDKHIKVYGLYGKDDGLYSSEQVAFLQKLIGDSSLRYLDDCSHNVFIDQQAKFIAALKDWQGKDATKAMPTIDSNKMKTALVSGDGYLYSVTAPDGWKSDQQNAKEFDAEIVLFMNNDSVNNGGALVQLVSFRKADDSTAEDLKSDIEQYKNNFPNLVEEDFSTQHPQYQCYGKCLYVEGDFFQYLVYVNPGSQFKRGVSVALNTSKRRPTDEEMRGFRQIVYSLVVLK